MLDLRTRTEDNPGSSGSCVPGTANPATERMRFQNKGEGYQRKGPRFPAENTALPFVRSGCSPAEPDWFCSIFLMPTASSPPRPPLPRIHRQREPSETLPFVLKTHPPDAQVRKIRMKQKRLIQGQRKSRDLPGEYRCLRSVHEGTEILIPLGVATALTTQQRTAARTGVAHDAVAG